MVNTKLKKEKINVFVYLVTDLFSKGIPFLLLPIYTIYLTPEQFGNISVFNVIVEILIIFVVFGANSYFRVEYFKEGDKALLLSTLIRNICLCIPAALLLMSVFVYFDINPSNQHVLWLFGAVGIASAQSFTLLFIAKFQCEHQAKKVGLLNVSSAIVAGGLTTLFLVIGFNEESRYISFIAASSITLFLAVFIYRKQEDEWPQVSNQVSIPAFKFGLGVLPHALSWWARTGMDRFIIAKFVSMYQVGLYSIAAQLSLVVIVFSNAVNQAFTPKIMKMLVDKQYMKTLNLCLKVLLLYFLVCLGLSVLSPLIFEWFIDDKFKQAQELLSLMCVVAFFQASVTLLSNFLYFFKQVKLLSSITFVTSLSHVIIAFNVVEKYGVNGVILSSIVTYVVSALTILGASIWLIRRELNAKT